MTKRKNNRPSARISSTGSTEDISHIGIAAILSMVIYGFIKLMKKFFK